MAAVHTIDLGHQTFSETVCDDKVLPDHASSFSVRGFHNRNSSLFPTTHQNRLFTHRTEEKSHHDKGMDDLASHCSCTGKPPTSFSKSKILNRVQSAKGRLEKNARTHSDTSSAHGKMCKHKQGRPYSAFVERSVNRCDKTTPRHVPSSIVKRQIPSGKRATSASGRYSSQQYCYGGGVSDIQIEGLDKLEINNNNGFSYDPYEMAMVPINGRPMPVVDIGDDAPMPVYNYKQPLNSKHVSNEPNLKPFHTPWTNKVADKSVLNDIFSDTTTTKDKVTNKDKEKEDRLKPSVFGLEKKRHIFGSVPDVSEAETGMESFPFKLNDGKNSQGMLQITDGLENKERPLPESLEPLRPWLTEDITEDLIGLDPKKCLVFLPSLIGQDLTDIPEVPPPHTVKMELPFKEKIIPPEVPKKYDHPAFNKKPLVEDWVCEHSKTHNRIYGADGSILHERCQGERTPGVIRKEIQELEHLIRGIGSMDTDCSIVKYQAEIDKFRLTHEQTMALVPERLLITPRPSETDTFGIREFCRQHDVVMHQIREQHKLCLEELALLEADAGIESERKYFKHQVHLPRSDESVAGDDTPNT